ncbi:hypothetical protein C8R43DRAFT_962415 [Mycena crocata]|nr:hypothetical protein C8R43DRAFT_962415 [Mycena crocata]
MATIRKAWTSVSNLKAQGPMQSSELSQVWHIQNDFRVGESHRRELVEHYGHVLGTAEGTGGKWERELGTRTKTSLIASALRRFPYCSDISRASPLCTSPMNPSSHAKVPLERLSLNATQRSSVDVLYESGQEFSIRADPDNATAQKEIRDLLLKHGLDIRQRERLENWWNVQWSVSWPVQGGKRRRSLLQCSCGYNTAARQETDEKKPNAKKVPQASEASTDSRPWTRQNPYDFTGCLAHVDITERESDGAVSSIIGCLSHNVECQNSVLKRLPAIPLHPHVYEVALEQLKSGSSVSAIQTKNIEMMQNKSYRDMDTFNPAHANFRYQYLPSDSRQLYRLYTRSEGIDVSFKPQYNIDNWMNPTSPYFCPQIHDAIFHYSARCEQGDRLKICISTPAMDEAAWKYGHQSQIILDGTFGVCSSRMLLFIAMGIDEDGHGVPLAFFLFSAPTGTRATHAGYNREILRELLTSWRDHLSRGRPYTKERGALLDVWPNIWLLLCKFHLRQCWTNKRKSLKLVPSLEDPDFWKDYVNGQLLSLEARLIETTDINAAHELIENEHQNLLALKKQQGIAQSVIDSGLTYLDYLVKTWMPEALWQSWSRKGRLYASTLLNISVEGVLPTTNHLESFNGLLKRKYLPRWQHSGTRLRVDFLIFTLITKILPEIFTVRRSIQDYKSFLKFRFQNYAGGVDLVQLKKSRQRDPEIRPRGLLCWWAPDSKRDNEAQAIARLQRIYDIRQCADPNQYEATCVSSRFRAQWMCLQASASPPFNLGLLDLQRSSWSIFLPDHSESAERNLNLHLRPPTTTQPSGAAVLHNFLALQKMAGLDPMAAVDGEENENIEWSLEDLMNVEELLEEEGFDEVTPDAGVNHDTENRSRLPESVCPTKHRVAGHRYANSATHRTTHQRPPPKAPWIVDNSWRFNKSIASH